MVTLALIGRVPVRVIGRVSKGQPVFADSVGVASAVQGQLVGIALESKTDDGEGLVECMLKL